MAHHLWDHHIHYGDTFLDTRQTLFSNLPLLQEMIGNRLTVRNDKFHEPEV